MFEGIFDSLFEENDWVVLDTNVLDSANIGGRTGYDNELDYKYELYNVLTKYEKGVTSPQVREEMDVFIRKSAIHHDFPINYLIKTIPPRELRGRYGMTFDYLKPIAEKIGIINEIRQFPYADIDLASVAFSLCTPGKKVAFLSTDMSLNDLVFSTVGKLKKKGDYRFPEIGELQPHRFSTSQGNKFIRHYLDKGRTHPSLIFQYSSGNSLFSS